MRSTLYRSTAPSYPGTLPVSVSTFKDHARITGTAEDTDIERKLKVATSRIERRLQRSLAAQTWTYSFDEFPCSSSEPILLLKPPVTSITSFKYILDSDGTDYTMVEGTDYQKDLNAVLPRLEPVYQGSWPTNYRKVLNSVRIVYATGYSTCPDEILQAITFLASLLYENREPSKTEKTMLDEMLEPFRIVRF